MAGNNGCPNDDSPEEAKARTENQVRRLAIPGVRCGKCLGRIDSGSVEMKRKLHDKLRPGQPFVPPSLCSECWLGAILTLCADADDDEETDHGRVR